MQDSNEFTRGLLARARDEVAKQNPEFWSWKEHGRELAGVLVEKGTAEYEGQRIPTRTFHRLDHGDYRTVWLWESPKRLRELDAELDPQLGDFVYIRVDDKKPKRDKPGEFWTPVFMHVTPAAEVDHVAREVPPNAVEEVDDHGTPITY